MGAELSLDQLEEKLLDKEGKQGFQALTGSALCLGKVTCYDITYTVNRLVKAMSKPSKAYMTAAEHLFHYLAGTKDFANSYKQRRFKLAVFSGANWGNDPNIGKSRPL